MGHPSRDAIHRVRFPHRICFLNRQPASSFPLAHQSTGKPYNHAHFLKGIGCKKSPNWELGGRMRVTLDRESPLYKVIYTQRTCCERINSQAKELGIERPRVRNRRSVANLNTLTYVIVNLRALQRAQSINRGLLQIS